MEVKDEYECISSLLLVSGGGQTPHSCRGHERKLFGPWLNGDLFEQLNAGKVRVKSKENDTKGASLLKSEDKISNQRRDLKRENASVNGQSLVSTSPSFSHFNEPSEYIKGYKDLKSKIVEYNAEVRPVRLYQGLPTTQIILNSASAIRRPRTNSNAYLRSGSSYSSKSGSSETTQEQFVLCSPTKVVTYDCTASQARPDGLLEAPDNFGMRARPAVQRKCRKKLIRADLGASAKSLCVNGIGESQRGLASSSFERQYSRMRVDTFPVPYSMGKQRIVTENLPEDFYLTGSRGTWEPSRRNSGNLQYDVEKGSENGKLRFTKQDARHYTLSAIS